MRSILYSIVLIYLSIIHCCECLPREMSATKSGITDQISYDYMLYRVKARSTTECLQRCTHTRGCMSFFFHRAQSSCQLHYIHLSAHSRLHSEPGWRYYHAYLREYMYHFEKKIIWENKYLSHIGKRFRKPSKNL